MSALFLIQLDTLAQDGQVRRLSAAFARFISSLSATFDASLALSVVVLSELEGLGHTCLYLPDLALRPAALLAWDVQQWHTLSAAAAPLPADAAAWQALLAGADQVWTVGQVDQRQPLVLDGDRLYLRRYWRDETRVAQAVAQRVAQLPLDQAALRRWLALLFDAESAAAQPPAPMLGQMDLLLAPPATAPTALPDWQKIACAIAVRSKISIITGGPGTGKTYTVARLLALLFALSDQPEHMRIALAAPTGKAAARLKQSIDQALSGLAAKVGSALPLAALAAAMEPARTLHSLLGARPDTRLLRHHAGNPIDVDVLILDEASMVHLEMMASLLAALPPHARLILLGDKDQLASVEAGAVLGDLCRDAEAGAYTAATQDYLAQTCGVALPAQFCGAGDGLAQQTVMLRHSHRFGGPIATLALAVNAGAADAAVHVLRAGLSTDLQELAWIERARQSQMLALALDGRAAAGGGYRAYLTLLAQHMTFTSVEAHEQAVRAMLRCFDAFRILCALRDGEWGVNGLNQAIAQRLEAERLITRRGEWYAGRPVMITRNDHSAGVFNGDVGIALPDLTHALRVYFLDGATLRSVLATRLMHVETAFAMTVHKSQGSEFRHTVLVLPPQPNPVLTRELIYTGITRASQFLTLVTPTAGVFEEALGKCITRTSGLQDLLARLR